MAEKYTPKIDPFKDRYIKVEDKLAVGRCRVIGCFHQFRVPLKGNKCPFCGSSDVHMYPKK